MAALSATVATAAYPVEALPDWPALERKLDTWIAEAGPARLVVFPEYAGLEAGLIGQSAPLTVAQETARCCAAAARYWALMSRLAQSHGKTILAGSLPAPGPEGKIVNRAALLRPDGQAAFIDKIILTNWERTQTPLQGQPGCTLFRGLNGLPDLGVLICYDGEFPIQARALAQAGARLLVMPSATEGMHGHTRVRLAARTRALEGGLITALAQIVGHCPTSAYADVSTGRAGLYTPPDTGLPETGILQETALNAPGWASAALPLLPAPDTRQVDIAAHWPEQATQAEFGDFHPLGQNGA